jgi:Ca2+/Na+ antiporter
MDDLVPDSWLVPIVVNAEETFNGRSLEAKKSGDRICHPGGSPGTMFPANPLGGSDDRMKGFIYGFFLLYSFIGVSIVADMFMSAIERITSKKRRVKIVGSSNRYITVNIWNETVANLTLMALGSSAPEILLAINDILKNRFHAGELGPSTIVGSAAFNLFVIVAVCVNAVPAGETRKIKETGVFFITAAFSLFAYLWLLFIVQVNTPDIVSVSEGAITFLFFPLLVLISYWSDAGYIAKWFNTPKEDPGESHLHPHSENGHHHHSPRSPRKVEHGAATSNGVGQLGRLGAGSHSGAGRYAGVNDPDEDDQEEESSLCCQILGSIYNQICALAGAIAFCANYFTSSSKASCSRCCRRLRRKSKKQDDDVVEKDTETGADVDADIDIEDPSYKVLDEDGEPVENETGIISFKSDSLEVTGNLEENSYTVPVLRKSGTDGRISCKYRMESFTATPGYDYVEEEGTLDFKNGIDRAEIVITILPKEVGEKNDQFQIILEEPTNDAIFNPSTDGGEDSCLMMITIINANPRSSTLQGRLFAVLDNWLNMDEMRQGSVAWCEQIAEAYYVNGSADAQDEAKALDWIMHVIFFMWKMFYAMTTPPPVYLGGWVCFVVSLMHIGVLTAFIGDVAELFGCVVGIDDSLTAISVVALGTSLPDLFASKAAATQDEWADASIVNVTGSNSVNVFLGIGLPWMMAAIYWNLVDAHSDALWREKYYDDFAGRCPQGCFVVASGNLGFSVFVFTIGAVVCLILIRVRRVLYDGELGGPANSDSKACSSFLMVLLWVFYIALSAWQTVTKTDSLVSQLLAILICIPVMIALMMFFGVMLVLLRISKEYIGEEGFFGVAVAVSLFSLRAMYFFVFQ